MVIKCGTKEGPILQIKILCHDGRARTDLYVFAQILHCDKWAILCREGQSSNSTADVPSLVPHKWIFI